MKKYSVNVSLLRFGFSHGIPFGRDWQELRWQRSFFVFKTTSCTSSTNVSFHNFLLQKKYFIEKIFDTSTLIGIFPAGFNQMNLSGWLLEQLRIKFCQNYRLRFFKQCLRWPFPTSSDLFRLNCPLSCLVPFNGNLIRVNCQDFQISWNLFEKHTWFFFKQPSGFHPSKFQRLNIQLLKIVGW